MNTETDGNQVTTQSSGNNRGSEALKTSPDVVETEPRLNPEGDPWDAVEELDRLLQAVDAFKAGASTRDGLWHYAEIARRAGKSLRQRPNISELIKEARAAIDGITPPPWCWESIAEKSNEFAVGTAFDEAGNQLSGELTPKYIEDRDEWVEDSIIQSTIGMNESGHANFRDARFIAGAPVLVTKLIAALEVVGSHGNPVSTGTSGSAQSEALKNSSSLCSSCPALEAEIERLKEENEAIIGSHKEASRRAEAAEARVAELETRFREEQARADRHELRKQELFARVEELEQQIISREDREKALGPPSR